MKISYLGHSALHIEFEKTHLVVDPFISGNDLAKHINLGEIKADYILVTHGHQDHILDVETIASSNEKVKLISNHEIVQWYAKKDIEGQGMNHGGTIHYDFGSIKYVNAIHSSSFPDGSYAGNPGGFVIYNDKKCIYIAGDTALTTDMKLIPETCPILDLAILPIGDHFTMGYEDAALAADFVQCNRILGCHYDTFPPITLDKDAAQSYFKSKNKELLLVEIGESIEI